MSQFFRSEVRQRLIDIHALRAGDGAQRFARVEQFVRIVAMSPGVPFIVPPELDADLRQVLSLLDASSGGFGLARMSRYDFGDSFGRAFDELTDERAWHTRMTLDRHGFTIDPHATYAEPVHALTVLAA